MAMTHPIKPMVCSKIDDILTGLPSIQCNRVPCRPTRLSRLKVGMASTQTSDQTKGFASTSVDTRPASSDEPSRWHGVEPPTHGRSHRRQCGPANDATCGLPFDPHDGPLPRRCHSRRSRVVCAATTATARGRMRLPIAKKSCLPERPCRPHRAMCHMHSRVSRPLSA
jgi:hypothetical protein